MGLYRAVLLLKLVAVLGYAGGLVAAFVASEPSERRRAAHGVASPSLLVAWLTGFWLATLSQVPLTEAWLVGGLLFSLASQLALVLGVSRGRRDARAFAFAAVPLLLVLALMVFRPTWSLLSS